MDPDRLEKFMRKDHARISGFHGASYTKKILRHLLWITVGVIVLIVLAITFLLYRRMRKAKQRKKMKEIVDMQSG